LGAYRNSVYNIQHDLLVKIAGPLMRYQGLSVKMGRKNGARERVFKALP